MSLLSCLKPDERFQSINSIGADKFWSIKRKLKQ